MSHRHERGDLLSQFFVTQWNSDSTEGRGHAIDGGIFEDVKDAHACAKGKGVMGCGDGNIIIRTYYRCTGCPEILKVDETIYYGDDYTKKHTLGGIGRYADFLPDGWRKDYSPMGHDPEYTEYLRLKRKFEKESR